MKIVRRYHGSRRQAINISETYNCMAEVDAIMHYKSAREICTVIVTIDALRAQSSVTSTTPADRESDAAERFSVQRIK